MDLKRYLDRARTAKGHGITYGLGKGGFDPKTTLPSDKDGKCDCSGFVAWVLGMSRKPKAKRNWWIESTNIYNDALHKQEVFSQLKHPWPGCIVVFPDRDGHEGHVGIVATSDSGYRVVDCTGAGITEHDGAYFRRKGAIFCILGQDLK